MEVVWSHADCSAFTTFHTFCGPTETINTDSDMLCAANYDVHSGAPAPRASVASVIPHGRVCCRHTPAFSWDLVLSATTSWSYCCADPTCLRSSLPRLLNQRQIVSISLPHNLPSPPWPSPPQSPSHIPHLACAHTEPTFSSTSCPIAPGRFLSRSVISFLFPTFPVSSGIFRSVRRWASALVVAVLPYQVTPVSGA